MSSTVRTEVLVPGPAFTGQGVVFDRPISFWGGIDPRTGTVIDPRHPQHGTCIAGTVLFLPGTIGSSSASSVLLELVTAGHAPGAIILPEADAILLLGLVVAREMGYAPPIALRLAANAHARFANRVTTAGADGRLESYR